MIDFLWQSCGGLLIDGSGDVAVNSDPMVSVADMVNTRLKAALHGWQLYSIGADLDSLLDGVADQEMEVAIRRQVMSALGSDFISSSSYTVTTARMSGGIIQVYVFLNSQLIGQATVNTKTVPAQVHIYDPAS